MSKKNLFNSIAEQLSEAKELINNSKAVTPEDRAQFQKLESMYESFVNQNLSVAPGSNYKNEEPKLIDAPVPMEIGASKNVKPVL